jgi:signal transduction histidine kinase/CheY-like chemotaxis protein
MNRPWTLGVFVGAAVVAIVPLLNETLGQPMPWLTGRVVAGINLLGWSIVITFLLGRETLLRSIKKVAQTAGLDTRFRSLEQLVEDVIREVSRKNSSLSINLIERRITSKEEFSRTLERIVALAYKLLDAESAELALFDKESGLYHSSFVLGRPFRTSAQAMLAGTNDSGAAVAPSPDVLVYPIAFAGTILGGLRVGLKRGTLPTMGDREIMRLLSLQSSLAIINARYTEELVRMKQYAEESVKAKTGFLANLSHELRGPLGIMLNAVELVLEGICGPVSADQLETLGMVRQNGEHLLDLINDVLDYAKIESGRLKPEQTTIEANEILEDLCAVVRSQAQTKRHVVTFKSSGDVLAFRCDRRHLRQMLLNMLTNAIKYTPDGGRIEVWAERVPGNKIKLNVKDSGVGIDPAQRHKVFAPFERVEHSYSITQVGAGLGMSLTKRLAEVNGGTIDFSCPAGGGSIFWVVLSATEFAPETRLRDEKRSDDKPGRGEQILLVAREDRERELVARYLGHAGFGMTSVGTLVAAVEALRARGAGLVLIDNDVLDYSSEDIVGALRSASPGTALPCVLLSSRAFVFDIEKYLRAGVDRCLSKPIDMQTLAQTCREVLDAKTLLGSAPGSASGAPEVKGGKAPRSRGDDVFH